MKEEEKMEALKFALSYLDSGFSVIPIKADGTKSPEVRWKGFQSERASTQEVENWFQDTGTQCGVAIICGKLSGNLEVLDFEQMGFFIRWKEVVLAQRPDLFAKIPVIATPGHGVNIYIRSEICEGNLKLARSEDGKIAIETRGEGGYVLAPGTPPDCHPLQSTYEQTGGEALTNLNADLLSVADRAFLFDCARSFDEVEVQATPTEFEVSDSHGDRPGDEFNQKANWSDLLEAHGWTLAFSQNETEYYRRPGKDDEGCSATVNYCKNEQSGSLLYVFSSNAAPFESHKAYSKFSAYAILVHDGNFAEAAKDLSTQGYGGEVEDAFLVELQEIVDKQQTILAAGGEINFSGSLLMTMCDNLKKFKKTWERDREDFGFDAARYDSSLIWYGIQAKCTPEEIIKLIYEHRKKHDDNPEKSFEVGYIGKKISFANKSASNEDNYFRSVETAEIQDGGSGDIIEQIRNRTKIEDFEGIIQRGESNARYWIVLRGGKRVQIGKTLDILKLDRFRIPVYDQLKITVPEMKKWEWLVVTDLFSTVTTVEALEDAREMNEVQEWIQEYLDHEVVHDEEEWQDALRLNEPFRKDGTVNLRLTSFRRYLNLNLMVFIDAQDLRNLLAEAGFKGKRITAKIDKKAVCRYYYVGIEAPL